MSSDLNNSLGFPRKYNQSYFRTWAIAGINSSTLSVYASDTPSDFELVGTALSVIQDTTNGTRVIINEAGLYNVSFSVRAANSFSVVKYNPVLGNAGYANTKSVVFFMDLADAGSRSPAGSGVIYCNPKDVIQVFAQSAGATSGGTFQVTKISPTL